MSKSNPVHLWRFDLTRALIFTQKLLNRVTPSKNKNGQESNFLGLSSKKNPVSGRAMVRDITMHFDALFVHKFTNSQINSTTSWPTVPGASGVLEVWKKMGSNFYKCFQAGRGGTVGQDVVELICQSERKMRQNATFYLWPLLSLKLDFFLMMVPKKLIFGHFCFFEGVICIVALPPATPKPRSRYFLTAALLR